MRIPEFILQDNGLIDKYLVQSPSKGPRKYKRFCNDYPILNEILSDYPETITKEQVIYEFQKVKNDDFYRPFLMTMVWGGIPTQRRGSTNLSNFDLMINTSKNLINNTVRIAKDRIKSEAHNFGLDVFMAKETQIKGVKISYATKVLYFLGQSYENQISDTPLVFDKWLQNAYLACLIQNHEDDYIKSNYDIKNYKLNEAVLVNSRQQLEVYTRFVKDMNHISRLLGISITNLENYFFGKRKNSILDNPRQIIINIIHEYILSHPI